jgi:hypothetical protein
MFCNSSCGKPCRCFKYSGLLYDSHVSDSRRHDPAVRRASNCGPNGAGHFVKMVHNGIEYGIMAAYAEGLSVLRSAPTLESKRARLTLKQRPCATLSTTSTNWISRTSPKCGGAAVSSRRGYWILLRLRWFRTPAFRSLPAACLTPAEDGGRLKPQSTKRCQHRFLPPLCTSDSAHVAKPTLRTNSCLPRVTNSAGIWRSQQKNQRLLKESIHD